MALSRFDTILKKHKDVVQYDGQDYKRLNPTGEKYNFKILAESAVAIHYSKVGDESRKYKQAVAEAVLLAQSEAFQNPLKGKIAEKRKEVKKEIVKQQGGAIGASLAGQFIKNSWDYFIKMLKLLWDHIKQFVLGFFDMATKLKSLQKAITNYLASLDKTLEKYKTFQAFDHDVDGILPVKMSTYLAGIDSYAKLLGKINTALASLDSKSGIFSKFIKGDKYAFQKVARDMELTVKESNTIADTYKAFAKKTTNKFSGKDLLIRLEALNKAFGVILLKNNKSDGSLLSGALEMKKRVSKSSVEEIVKAFQEKTGESDASVTDSLKETIRGLNKLLVTVNGNCKIFVGGMMASAMKIMKIVKKNIGVEKPKFKTPSVDINYDLKYGKAELMHGKEKLGGK